MVCFNAGMGLEEQYGFGARLLKKLGYVEGQGLGSDGRGRASPIEVNAEQHGTHAGLGMLSKRATAEDIDMDITSSSDEGREVNENARARPLQFKKTDATKPSSDIIYQIEALGLPVDANVLARHPNASTIVEELVTKQRTLDAIVRKVEVVKQELDDVETQLNTLRNLQHSEMSLLDKISEVLKLNNETIIDELAAKILKDELQKYNNLSLKDDRITNTLEPVVELLQYALESDPGALNKNQTQLYQWLCPRIEAAITEIDFKNSDSVDSIIYILVEYELILKYIMMYDKLIDKFLMPRLLGLIKEWAPERNGIDHHFYDFYILLNQEQRKKLQDALKVIFSDYCSGWYHKDAFHFDCHYFKLIFGETVFYSITEKKLLPIMVKQLYEEHFTLVDDLEDWSDINHDREGPAYCFKKVKEFANFLTNTQITTIMKGMFNDIRKLVFQWYLFSEPNDWQNCQNLIHDFFNIVYAEESKISDFEITELREILRMGTEVGKLSTVCYDREFDILKELHLKKREFIDLERDENDHPNVIQIDDSDEDMRDSDGYTVQDIPIRRVDATFKEILQRYCEENGYEMIRDTTNYTQLPYGINGTSLVPIITIRKGTKARKVAIKDGILWIEGLSGYRPEFLYNLTL